MNRLRRMPTSHLLALCAAVIALGVGGTAIASAINTGTPPPPLPLAQALHNAANGPRVTGLSAHVTFSNRLVDSSSLVGHDPLLNGADGRIFVDPSGHRLRLELTATEGTDSQLVVDNGSFWFYDGAQDTVYKGSLPQNSAGPSGPSGPEPSAGADTHQPPSVSAIQTFLDKLTRNNVTVSGATPGVTAGQGSYTVRLSPTKNGGLLGGVELAWDALRGVPLRVGVYAQGDSTPVLELKAKDVHYGALPSDAFSTAVPKGASVVNVSTPQSKPGAPEHTSGTHSTDHQAPVTGLSAVQNAVSFQVRAPATLNGLPRSEVRLVRLNASPGALITYGSGLSGIVVLERPHTAKSGTPSGASLPSGSGPASGDRHATSLPAVQIGSATGHELATALGTVITFQRADSSGHQVDYVVAGSVATHVAESAARAL